MIKKICVGMLKAQDQIQNIETTLGSLVSE